MILSDGKLLRSKSFFYDIVVMKYGVRLQECLSVCLHTGSICRVRNKLKQYHVWWRSEKKHGLRSGEIRSGQVGLTNWLLSCWVLVEPSVCNIIKKLTQWIHVSAYNGLLG